ncbi:MAG: SGNH/GDSL hydrolase family protein [candidate division Zixibacteria bacterium]|nr:SGNH/GDSL hydrolase family protein [candidate division Zixibacteria bacterium]
MFRRLALGCIVSLAVLLALEVAGRLVETAIPRIISTSEVSPGWQTPFFQSFLDWHEPDPDLLWRFKAGLDDPLVRTNSQHLIGEEFTKEKPPGVYRILLLGDSSPVGIGLKNRHQAFGELLARDLNITLVDYKSVELINAAVSGYTTEQLKVVLETTGWKYRPDLVIVYAGNNDASISGPLSDEELLHFQKLRGLRRAFSHLALYRLLRSVLTGSKTSLDELDYELKPRVSAERFGNNLAEIANQCRRHNCPLIIVEPPVPRLWPAGLQFKVFQHAGTADGRLIMPEQMRRLLGRNVKYCLDQERLRQLSGQRDVFTDAVYASAYADSMDTDGAILFYSDRLRRDSLDPVAANNLGVSYWEKGRYREADSLLKLARRLSLRRSDGETSMARLTASSPFLYNIGINMMSWSEQDASLADVANAHLDSALQADYFSLRVKRDYLREIERLADREDVFVADLRQTFADNGGEALFIDHCHPTPEGHRLIADYLHRLVLQQIMRP